jgi:GT2 family glycosyltransferase
MLSVVILTCNSRKYISKCLASVFSQTTQNFEAIVVDNASSDGTKEFIRSNYPKVKLIENPRNFGASKARNQGVESSFGEWVLALDSDVVLGNDFIEQFFNAQNRFSSDIGMVQPNILNVDGKTVYSQGIYLSAIKRFHDLNRGKPKDWKAANGKRILGPCSAAAFYRRSMLEKLKEKTGYFDERFFFLVEDVDLAWRAQRAGWEALFCPQMVCTHDGNSSNTGKKFRQYLCFRNRHWMIAKNKDFLGRLGVYALSAPYELVRGAYLAISNKHFWTGA